MAKQRSLKWVLIFSLVLGMALPLIVSGGIFTRVLADAMKKQILSANESLSYSFIDQIESYLNNSLEDLLTLRTMVEKQDFEMLNHTSLLDSIRQNKDHFTKIQIINRIGYTRFVSPHHRDYINLDMSRNLLFTEPVRTQKPYWSPTFISEEFNRPAVSVSIPFENGVMAGYISLENLSRAAAKIGHGKNIQITITDQTSSYIVHYRNQQVYQRGFDPNYARFRKNYQGKLINEVITYEGQDMFVTAGMIPRTDWAILFYQPVQEVFGPIRLFYGCMILGLVILFGVTIMLCVKHIDLVISTLDKFTRSAKGITLGLYEKNGLSVQYKEFSSLKEQFETMADAIQTREMELKDKEEKYRSIFTAAQDAILLVDAETGRVMDVNSFACDLFQYRRKEFLDLTIRDIAKSPGLMEEKLAARKAWIPESRYLKKDGTQFPAELSISFFNQPDAHTICTVVARDITKRVARDKEKEQMQQMLGQAQKMEAIGRLAGGIAHDFNNILTAIVGYGELSQSKAPKESPLVRYSANILKAAHRAKELVDQILTFARFSRAEKKPVQINLILKEVHKFIRASIPSSIEIKMEISSTHWVMADPIQLHQVIMNLCTNAWHAMKETGGILTLKLDPLAAPFSTGTGNFLPGQTVCLAVEDSGCGIDPQILPKIFDPYFTTKSVGEGSGMGLSVVQGILRDMDAHIEVKSVKGQGSSFVIYLPTARVEEKEGSHKPAEITGGTERLLLVDDEKDITRAMTGILESLGYRVEDYNDPKQALEHFKKEPKRFDLIISDMTMPGMNGGQLATEILALSPDMPIIICTGFHETMTPEIARDMMIRGFLYKPVERRKLAAAIRKALVQGTSNH